MDFNGLTEEQNAKARACESAEELVALAAAEGIELSDDQLNAIAGGSWYSVCNDNVCSNHYYT